MDYTILNNGTKMPMQGFGVFQIPDYDICRQAVTDAIKTGYRLIDTASVYGNEKAVGAAVRDSGISREELFITSKAWISEMGYNRTVQAFDASLERLELDYLDLYLVHMPFGDYYGAWKAMENIYLSGRVRAIGVCNFEPDRLIDLCKNARVVPAVDQIEIHPYVQQTESVRIMQTLGVQAEAWGPFAEGRDGIFTNPVLSAIAGKYKKSVAQIVLRWHMQRGIVAIPKSVHKARMEENYDIGDFCLSDDDMYAISALEKLSNRILDIHAPSEVERLYGIECKY